MITIIHYCQETTKEPILHFLTSYSIPYTERFQYPHTDSFAHTDLIQMALGNVLRLQGTNIDHQGCGFPTKIDSSGPGLYGAPLHTAQYILTHYTVKAVT